jgi:3-methyladenine DNA glycosylase AlkD
MAVAEILEELRPLGRESYKKVLLNDGISEPCFGVKIEELKKIQKRIKADYRLALDLYETGIYDAMYLAGLIADDRRMTREDLQRWADMSNCGPLSTSTVAWVAAGSDHGRELALRWIESPAELVAAAGWATLCSLVAIKDDSQLDLAELEQLLQRIRKTVGQQPNLVRSAMNAFMIAVGTHVRPLTDLAAETGAAIGPVSVDVGNTACQVPYAPDAIQKARERGMIGKKRKTAKC